MSVTPFLTESERVRKLLTEINHKDELIKQFEKALDEIEAYERKRTTLGARLPDRDVFDIIYSIRPYFSELKKRAKAGWE